MRRSPASLGSQAPWLALVAAFSPVLVDLARNLAEYPEDRVTLLAPLLLLLALRREAAGPAAGQRDGAIAIGLGVALQMLGVFAHSLSIAAVGLPFAALGLARWLGRPRAVVIALVFFAIPLPDSLVLLPSSTLETWVARGAGAILRGIGLPVEARGFSLVGGAGRIELRPAECGVVMAFACAALGWCSAALAGAGIAAAARRAAQGALLALPLQALVVLVSGALLAAGLRDAAWLWLSQGSWIAASALGLTWLHLRARASG